MLHTSKTICCCPTWWTNSVNKHNTMSFQFTSSSAPALQSVLLPLWQRSSVRKMWSIWSTNYILGAMITCTLQYSGQYVMPLNISEVCAITCHFSSRTSVVFCSMTDLIHAVRAGVDHYVSCYLLTAAFHGVEFCLTQERISVDLPSSQSHRGLGICLCVHLQLLSNTEKTNPIKFARMV